ncbi:glycosyltransferase family 2 protein [Candidatus Wolfebacteria bacterium]|nr:glycosyltransferase family 2 protein [Candidatus Wolfebacteria bacterium]
MKLPISVIILTYNEELNIENCLKSISDWANEIIIVDCFSIDKTLDIVRKYTDRIYQHPFVDYAQQFNWALDNVDIKGEWVMKLDADERIPVELWREIARVLPNVPTEVNGFYIKRRVYFMGKWIKHGGYYPTWILRLWRKGFGRLEQRQMDEHTILSSGKTLKLKNDFFEENKKNLTTWIDKHNKYAAREIDSIMKPLGDLVSPSLSGSPVERKRWFKERFYLRLPLFCRAFLYFIYRYFFRLGFLDGKQGLIFHFLQGCWYRFLVDAKLYEARKARVEKAGKI